MSDGRIRPVILCGGGGTRLWPLSTPERPKPFLRLTGSATMLELTLARVRDRALFDPPLIVADARHADAIAALVAPDGANPVRLLLEPISRNTAAAAAFAALVAEPDE